MGTGRAAVPQGVAELATFYRDHLERVILPFWLDRTLDEERGGLFNCVDDVTGARLSDDKFVWSQARWAWTAAHAARMADRGLLRVDGDRLRRHARLTADFLLEHAFLEDGSVAYLLTADGQKKEFLPGKGHDISFYADCFVTLALAGVARAVEEEAYLERALRLYSSVRRRLASGTVRSEPYPLPPGGRAHGWPMISLNVAQELERALKAFGDERHEELAADALDDVEEIFGTFVRDDGLVTEVKVPGDDDSLLARHVTPGHAIESMWFVIEQALAHGREDVVREAASVIVASFDAGWDPQHGGLFRYVVPGPDGPQPRGEPQGPFEELIVDTWDGKIWWPHSEALYAGLLGVAALDGVGADDDRLRRRLQDVHDRTFAYAFATFPNPDASVGEWIQVRDRQGRRLQKVMGLPVKDPYHVTRNLLLLIELLEEGLPARTTRA
jgi:N-acylglucosamine 2-epimerase